MCGQPAGADMKGQIKFEHDDTDAETLPTFKVINLQQAAHGLVVRMINTSTGILVS